MASVVPAHRDAAPSMWARVVGLFVDYATARGATREALLTAGGIDDRALEDPDGRVALAAFCDVIEAAVRALDDPSLGLHFPTELEIADLDALGFLMLSSRTFGQGLERMLRYQRVWSDGHRLSLAVDGSRARVRYEVDAAPPLAREQLVQMAFSDFVVNGSRFVPNLSFERALVRASGPHGDDYERVLGIVVELGAPVDEVWFAAEMLELPMPEANEALFGFFDRYASGMARELPAPDGIAGRVRALLIERLPEGDFKLADVATHLHMSARTLQRRLKSEGTTLQEQLEIVRYQKACYFLEAGMAIAELSWLLGYSEPAAFHHAFKRWTGQTPSAWRAARVQAPIA